MSVKFSVTRLQDFYSNLKTTTTTSKSGGTILSDEVLELVDEETQRSIRKYKLVDDQIRSLIGRCLTKLAIYQCFGTAWSTIRFGTGAHGKPHMINEITKDTQAQRFEFSIAHQSNLVVMAWLVFLEKATKADSGLKILLGVDVTHCSVPYDGETIDEFILGMEDCFSPAEYNSLHRLGENTAEKLSRMMALWALKESYVKATGLGLRQELKSIEFAFNLPADQTQVTDIRAKIDGKELLGWYFALHRFDDEYWIAVSVYRGLLQSGETKETEITVVPVSDIFEAAALQETHVMQLPIVQ